MGGPWVEVMEIPRMGQDRPLPKPAAIEVRGDRGGLEWGEKRNDECKEASVGKVVSHEERRFVALAVASLQPLQALLAPSHLL